MALVDDVLAGVRNQEFEVAFQPIVHVQTGTIRSVECLLRWRHPQYGLLLAGAFDSALRDSEVARETFFFVLDSACRQLANVENSESVVQGLNINIQPSMLTDDKLTIQLYEAAARYGICPSVIELEILETEDASVHLTMQEWTAPIKRQGIRLALDDFGTGYSSLSAVFAMPIDTVKLAPKFMSRVPELARASDGVDSILDLLKRMNLTAVVEGVESEIQLDWLRQRGNVYAQGFHVACPVSTLAAALFPRKFTSAC